MRDKVVHLAKERSQEARSEATSLRRNVGNAKAALCICIERKEEIKILSTGIYN